MENKISRIEGAYSLNDLENVMRLFFNQQVMWTRFYILSKTLNIEDLVYIKNRLFMIPKDIGNVLGIYYGENIGNTFENLFYNQVSITIQMIDAYIQNASITLIEDIIKSADKNTSLIAKLLSQFNPYFKQRELEDLFCCQLELIKEMVIKRINKEYLEEINSYDFIEYHVLMIADVITDGIAKQFYARKNTSSIECT